MSRKPLVVDVMCDEDGCDKGVIVHGRGEEISIQWLEAHLIQEGWATTERADGTTLDICPGCTKGKKPKRSKKAKTTKKKARKKK